MITTFEEDSVLCCEFRGPPKNLCLVRLLSGLLLFFSFGTGFHFITIMLAME